MVVGVAPGERIVTDEELLRDGDGLVRKAFSSLLSAPNESVPVLSAFADRPAIAEFICETAMPDLAKILSLSPAGELGEALVLLMASLPPLHFHRSICAHPRALLDLVLVATANEQEEPEDSLHSALVNLRPILQDQLSSEDQETEYISLMTELCDSDDPVEQAAAVWCLAALLDVSE
jgi:hypothetical protein